MRGVCRSFTSRLQHTLSQKQGMPKVGKRLIDAIPATPRTREMQLLCFGLPRTVNKLGIKCYHGGEIYFAAPGTYDLWNEALRAKLHGDGDKYGKAEFEKLLGNYGAITDVPCILFMEELLECYPNAKVLITQRDEDSWIRSVKGLFNTVLRWNWGLVTPFDKVVAQAHITRLTLEWNHWTKGDWDNDDRLREVFRNHYAKIRSMVPPERLLEFDPEHGWGPLCEHLGIKEIPSEPYPHVNELAQTINVMRKFWWIAAIKGLVKITMVAALPGAAIFLGRYWRK